MAEYIERDLTIQFLCEACSNFEGNICTLPEECEDIRIIRAMSAENVQPVRRGTWQNIRLTWIPHEALDGWVSEAQCSNCLKWAQKIDQYADKFTYEICPHCGADMRDEDNG